MRYFPTGTLLAVLVLPLTAAPAWCHELGGQAKIVKDKIEIEAYYDDGSDARGASVQVLSAKKKVVASGVTDSKSKWTCKLLPPGKYTAVVKHGGHEGIIKFTIKESEAQVMPVAPAATESNPAGGATTPPANAEQGKKSLELVSEGPSREEFTDFPWVKLFLGLGVIGLLGLGMLIAVRQQRKRKQAAAPPASGPAS